MNSRIITSLFLCCLLLLPQSRVLAFETDQYDLPPKPLADLGDEVSEHVEKKLRRAVDKINAEISVCQTCLAENGDGLKKSRCRSAVEERARLSYLRSNDAVAERVYAVLGSGVQPFTSVGLWMDTHHFRGQPARYKTSFWKSIFLPWPTDSLTISPTVDLYGSQFGTDKIAHMFQQGYNYYRIYTRSLATGATPDEATRKAVRWGQMTERTIFGTLVAGVYSNGDLCANYVGMKFYQGLTAEIKIGDKPRPAILNLKDGFWALNANVNHSDLLIKPFISDHLNEALNPSIFTDFLGLRSYVRRTVRKRSCKQWLHQYPGLSEAYLDEEARALRLWYGEDYGFTNSDRLITLANTCFEKSQANGDR